MLQCPRVSRLPPPAGVPVVRLALGPLGTSASEPGRQPHKLTLVGLLYLAEADMREYRIVFRTRNDPSHWAAHEAQDIESGNALIQTVMILDKGKGIDWIIMQERQVDGTWGIIGTIHL